MSPAEPDPDLLMAAATASVSALNCSSESPTPAKPLASPEEPAALVDRRGVEDEPSARLKIGAPPATVVVTTNDVVVDSLVDISYRLSAPSDRMLNKLLPQSCALNRTHVTAGASMRTRLIYTLNA